MNEAMWSVGHAAGLDSIACEKMRTSLGGLYCSCSFLALFSLLFSFVAIMIECAALPFDMSCALFVRDAQQLLSLMSLAVGIGLIIRVVLLMMASCLAAIN